MKYTDDNRGQFQCLQRAKQLVSFEGLKDGNRTPTDVDGYIERGNRAFILFELKHRNADMPAGQRMALERLIDALSTANKRAVLFLASHDIDDPEEPIIAATAEVTGIYFEGKWVKGAGRTLQQMIDDFFAWALR